MYYIEYVNNEYSFVNGPVFLNYDSENQRYDLIEESKANIVAVMGQYYYLNTPINNLEKITIIKEEDWDETIKGKHNKRLCEKESTFKTNELKESCTRTIQAGSKVTLTTGEKEFSYSLEDQSNINEMFNAVALGGQSYPYHANGEDCSIYNAQDIISIYTTLSLFKTSHLTYYNQLRAYVNSLESVENIKAVTYGQELTGEFLENYNSIMEQAQNTMQSILEKSVMSKVE